MKKLIVLSFFAVILAACQTAVTATPTPTDEPAPTEMPTTVSLPATPVLVDTLATQKSQLQGVWYYFPSDAYLQLRGNGAVHLYRGLGNLVISGSYSFEDGKMIWGKDTNCDIPATYEIYILEKAGKTVGMRPKLIGEDTCADRRNFLDGMVFQCVNNAPASCNTP